MTRFSQPSFLQGAPRPLVLSFNGRGESPFDLYQKVASLHPALLSLGKRERRGEQATTHFLAAARLLSCHGPRPRRPNHHRAILSHPSGTSSPRPALNERPICRRFLVGQSDASVMISYAGWSPCQQSPWTISHSPTCTSRCMRWSPRSIIEPIGFRLSFVRPSIDFSVKLATNSTVRDSTGLRNGKPDSPAPRRHRPVRWRSTARLICVRNRRKRPISIECGAAKTTLPPEISTRPTSPIGSPSRSHKAIDRALDRLHYEQALYQQLRSVNPSPFSGLLRFGDMSLISCSPERLVRLQGRRADTRPIAGTRPRGRNPHDDRRLVRELLANEKETG